MSDTDLKIAYLREYPSEKCDIRFVLTIKETNGESTSKEIISFAENTETLATLKKNIQDKIKTHEKKEEDDLITFPDEIEVLFLGRETPYGDDMTLDDFNKLTDEDKYIKVLGQTFSICFNAPLIRQLTLPYVICARFPVKPSTFITQFCERTDTKFIWSKSSDKEVWDQVGEEYQYHVRESDIGYFLKMCCIPFNGTVKGPIVEAISENKVEFIAEFPTRCPFERRHTLTKDKLDKNKFRVVSYNVLADKYVNADRFSHCQNNTLCIHYRKELLMRELGGYNADIICLQEVDTSHYYNYFKKELTKNGYTSAFNKKGNFLKEGLVCAFNTKRFKRLETKQFVFKKIGDNKQYSAITNMLKFNRELKEKIMQQQTSLQTTVLEEKKTGNIVIVGNTHLYYHPDADDVRLIQALIATKSLYNTKTRIMNNHGTDNVSIILCGDFNSDFAKSLYSFMTTGKIDPRHEDCLKISPSGKAKLYHSLRLCSAAGTPKYTNYTKDYKGCLDYIFVQKDMLSVITQIPLPTEEDLEEYVGLPNEFYPSDHLALVVDLEFKL